MCKTTSALVPPRSDLPSLPAASQTVVAAAKRLMDRMDAQRAEIAQLLRAVKATLRAQSATASPWPELRAREAATTLSRQRRGDVHATRLTRAHPSRLSRKPSGMPT
jgi:predicted trehalose synthase